MSNRAAPPRQGTVHDIRFSAPSVGAAEAAAVRETIESRWIVGGPRLAELERAIADHCRRRHGIGVTSWTTGAFLVLHAWGIGPGDEVIVPSYSFIATANVVAQVGATPVFADIDPVTWNIDPDNVESRITSRTRAIIPVDQVGLPCDMDAILAVAGRHGLRVLQDAACALGSRYRDCPVGDRGDVAIFSLHARKLVTTGEGGMIVCDDPALARRLATLRHQGASLSDRDRHAMASTVFERYDEVGFNFRLTDIQAAMGLVQFGRLDEILSRRRAQVAVYQRYFGSHPHVQAPVEPQGYRSNWQSYMIGIRADAPLGRDEVMRRLDDAGVPTRRSVMASHLEPVYAGAGARLPATEAAFRQNLLLPVHHDMSEDELAFVIARFDEILPAGA